MIVSSYMSNAVDLICVFSNNNTQTTHFLFKFSAKWGTKYYKLRQSMVLGDARIESST